MPDYSPFAGEIRERVIVQQEIDTPDDAGGAEVRWVDKDTVYARIVPLGSTTRILAREQALDITHRVTVRYLRYLAMPDKSRYRLVWQGHEMKITGVTNPDTKRRFIDIECVLGQMVAA